MKLFKSIFLLLSLICLTARAAQPTVGGRPVVLESFGTATDPTIIRALLSEGRNYVVGTNVTIDFSQRITYWNTTNAPAVRFAFSNLPTDTNSAEFCEIVLIGQIGTLVTNVADSLNFQGSWGVLVTPTNHFYVSWNGLNLLAEQSPFVGIISPAQLVANTDNWNPTGFTTADEIRIDASGPINITGLVGQPYGRKLLHNISSSVVTFKNNVTSTATNRFLFSTDLGLASNQSVILDYDLISLRWRAVSIVVSSVSEANLSFTDITTANATTNAHGLMPKPDGNASHVYLGDGSQGVSPGSSSSTSLFKDMSSVYTNNTAIEYSLYTNNTAIPANTLGTNNQIRIRMGASLTNASGSGVTYTIKLYLNGVAREVIAGPSITAGTSGLRNVDFEIIISELNSTASQMIASRLTVGAVIFAAPTVHNGSTFIDVRGQAATALDETASISLGITMTMGTAASTIDFWKTSIIATVVQ